MKKHYLLCVVLMFSLFVALTGCGTSSDSTSTSTSSTTTEESSSNPSSSSGTDKNTEKKDEDTEKESETASSRIQATVTRVVDGDTLRATVNGKEEKVRLILVDTPETVHPSKPVQPVGPEASSFTKKMLSNKKIEIEPGVQERDRYGRLLAYIYVDGKMFNKILIEKGLARVAVFPPNTRYLDEFKALEQKAKAAKLGIWQYENYVTDKGYNDTVVGSTYSSDQSSSQSSEKTSTNTTPSTQNTPEPVKETGSCTIKGNISSSGEKIYHMPGGAYYDRTIAEEMFCSTNEAENHGYHASQR
ncbi:thermonuclease family protein [Priestia endophytica]|uniref:thermonuclease family protein n=1 Tax=Priestia endophytica TaxID=135735 RepID=UPI00124CA199|nr:thermonuclease family protein [Priestia endophytica]KAB2486574.1 thermonuclease family protein [Priestia endophytica]